MSEQIAEEEIIGKRAEELMRAGWHCSEAVLIAVGEHIYGSIPEAVLHAANGFRGGIGATREEVCGCFSAGVIISGLKYGRNRPETDDSIGKDFVQGWRKIFIDEFSTTRCLPIYNAVREPGAPGTCAVIANEAARLLLRYWQSFHAKDAK